MEGVALAFSGDEGYGPGLAVALHSALSHLTSAPAPEIYVADCGFSAATRGRLERVARHGGAAGITWLDLPEDTFEGLGTVGYLTVASYARVLVPDLMPAHVRRLVYLDADLLVLGDLAPLFEVDLGSAAVGAVRDYAVGSIAQRWPEESSRLRPGRYYNTGVLVIDVEAWRDAKITERTVAAAAKPTVDYRFMDQDALNTVIDAWAELDYRWNVQQTLFLLDQTPVSDFRDELIRDRAVLSRDAAILHFVSLPKPWYHGSFLPGTMPWARSLVRSGWFAGPLERGRWLAAWLAKRVYRRVFG